MELFVGAAPDADFYLYATEDGTKEIPEEELYWFKQQKKWTERGWYYFYFLGYADFWW